MPNHCENELTVSGDAKALERFKVFAQGNNPWDNKDKELLCCNQFIPAPPKAIADYSNVGYNWCIERWGTKWGAYDIELSCSNGHLFYAFLSAWAPPIPVIKAMARKFKALDFDLRYYEGGMGFQGHLRLERGRIVIEESGDYSGSRGG